MRTAVGINQRRSAWECASHDVLRYSQWDALLVGLALVHGLVVVAAPSAPLIAIGLWWNANTVSHLFVHKPFFRLSWLNMLFAMYLSLLLGFPHEVWRERHLAHHAGLAWRPRLCRQLLLQLVLALALWGTLFAMVRGLFWATYLPGLLAGLALCFLHGRYEHVGGGTVSYYGRLYNLFFLNDGYHVEHHANPGTHWSGLPARIDS